MNSMKPSQQVIEAWYAHTKKQVTHDAAAKSGPGPDLANITRTRKQLLRSGVASSKVAATDLSKALGRLLTDGEPENGLAEGIKAAKTQIDEGLRLLVRVEETRFGGVR